MNEQLLFSVIIPSYNRGDFIMKAIETVFAQSYEKFELIVIDDGSSDNTVQLLEGITDPRFKFLATPNRERGAARNTGAKIALGEYLNFFDSDDLLLSNHLSLAAESAIKLGKPEIFHLNYEVRDTKYNLIRTGRKHGKNGKANSDLVWGNPFSCNGVFIRRDVALSNPFNEDRGLSASEDYELWLRLGSRYTLHTIDAVSSVIVSHEGRSVLNVDMQKLMDRKELLLKYAFEDPYVKKMFWKKQKAITAYCDTYIALHLIVAKKQWDGLRFFIKGLLLHPACIYDKRTLGIIKHVVLNSIEKSIRFLKKAF